MELATKEKIMLASLFLLVLAIRLIFVFQQPYFEYDSYYEIRQADHIRDTGKPLFKDDLSYSGRMFLSPPFFSYVLGGLSLVFPLELVAKILPNLLLSSLVIIIYLITKQITKNRTASFIASLFAGFVPLFFSTLNQVSSDSLAIFFIFALSYAFLRLESEGFDTLCLLLAILLLLTSSLGIVFFITLIVYLIVVKLEKFNLTKREMEITLFLFFLAIWFNIILYKKAFLLHGIRFIWQNLPASLLAEYFHNISIAQVLYAVGIVPLILGVYAVYQLLFKTKNRSASLYLGFTIVTFILLWLKLVPFKSGLLLLSINLIILSSHSLKVIFVALSKTKFIRFSKPIIAGIILLFALTTLIPLVTTSALETPSKEDIAALKWINKNTDREAVVLGRVKEGFLISYLAERKNVADNNFLFISGIDTAYEDVNKIYTNPWKAEAIQLVNKYDIDYLLLSEGAKEEYRKDKLAYAERDCFEIVYDGKATIYKFLGCKLDEQHKK